MRNGETVSCEPSLQSTLIVERGGHQKAPVLSIPSGVNEEKEGKEGVIRPSQEELD